MQKIHNRIRIYLRNRNGRNIPAVLLVYLQIFLINILLMRVMKTLFRLKLIDSLNNSDKFIRKSCVFILTNPFTSDIIKQMLRNTSCMKENDNAAESEIYKRRNNQCRR